MAVLKIKDLASQLGLSESTVSKSLNDRPDVSNAVKERVRSLARELGYSPNVAARRLALGENRSIGVFLLNRGNRRSGEYFGFSFLNGVMKEAQDQAHDVLVFSDSPERGYLEYARAKGVAGVVFISMWPRDPRMAGLAQDDLPWVAIDCPVDGARRGYISCDNAQGMELLMDAVWGTGRRRLAYLGIQGGGYVAQKRRAGFENFCLQAGLDPLFCLRETSIRVETGYRAAQEMIIASKPEVIVCASDLQALGALRAVRDLGLSVLDDVAITGFDDIPAAAFSQPSLTTVAQDAEAMGQAAVQSLLGRANPEPVFLPVSLVMRESL